jgi:putative mycofactocin binding protein MftB
MPALDLALGWDFHPPVCVRPEPFGALLYHFGTRTPSFLKDTTLLSVVRTLVDVPSARAACTVAGVSDCDLPRYQCALGTLAKSSMVVERAS